MRIGKTKNNEFRDPALAPYSSSEDVPEQLTSDRYALGSQRHGSIAPCATSSQTVKNVAGAAVSRLPRFCMGWRGE